MRTETRRFLPRRGTPALAPPNLVWQPMPRMDEQILILDGARHQERLFHQRPAAKTLFVIEGQNLGFPRRNVPPETPIVRSHVTEGDEGLRPPSWGACPLLPCSPTPPDSPEPAPFVRDRPRRGTDDASSSAPRKTSGAISSPPFCSPLPPPSNPFFGHETPPTQGAGPSRRAGTPTVHDFQGHRRERATAIRVSQPPPSDVASHQSAVSAPRRSPAANIQRPWSRGGPPHPLRRPVPGPRQTFTGIAQGVLAQ